MYVPLEPLHNSEHVLLQVRKTLPELSAELHTKCNYIVLESMLCQQLRD